MRLPLALTAAILSLSACAQKTPPSSLLYVKTPSNIAQQEKEYTGFIVNFNRNHHVPNYVAWELTREETDGPIDRKEYKFKTDESVRGCAQLKDYRKSGWSRGHMVPAADMKWSRDAMRDSYSLANMVPQDSKMNQGVWGALEGRCRQWARRDGALIIISGPVLTEAPLRKIGDNVTVPKRLFKVILSPTSNPPRAIGFIFNNEPSSRELSEFAVSVDEVEALTGLDFFSALPDDIETQIEAHGSFFAWERSLPNDSQKDKKTKKIKKDKSDKKKNKKNKQKKSKHRK